MSGNTYKWLGGQGAGSDPNDATLAANWLIEQSGSFVPSVTTPGSGDTAFLDSGTADLLFTGSESADISGITFDFGGAGATLSLANVSLSKPTEILVGAGDRGALTIGAGVQNDATMEVGNAASTLSIALNGLFDNQGVILAQNAGTVDVTPGSGGTLDNEGGVVALGGAFTVGVPVIGTGLMVVAAGTLSLTVAVGAAQSVAFTEGPATLAINDPEQFDGSVLGFQAGETIDLPTVHFKTIQPVTLVDNVATITDGFGDTLDLGLPGSGLTAADFVTTPDPSGGTKVTVPGVVDPERLSAVGGAWSTGADWSTGAEPGSAATAIIANLGTAFEVSTTGLTTVGSLLLLASEGTLAVGGTFDVARSVDDAVGTIAVATSGDVIAETFAQLGGGATLTMAAGAAMTLAGGASLPAGNGVAALDVEGEADFSGATLDAAAGSVLIGWTGHGDVTAENGADVAASYTDIGGSGSAEGALTLDNSLWRDIGGDTSSQYAGEMLVGGGALGPSGAIAGGVGQLVIQDNAVLTDFAGAIIGAASGSQGSATVQTGGTWAVGGNLTVGGGTNAIASLLVQKGISQGAGPTAGFLDVAGTIVVDGSMSVDGGGVGTAAALDLTGGELAVDGASVLNIGTTGPGGGTGLVIDVGASATLGAGAFSGLLTVLGDVVTTGATLNGTLAGPGTVFVGSFTTLTINDAGPWTTDISFAAGGSADLVLSGATPQGLIETPAIPQQGVSYTIDLTGLTYDANRAPSYNPSDNMLTLGGDSLVPVTLEVSGVEGIQFALVPDRGTGTDIVMTQPCYVAGTRLATPGGEAAVEALRAGDLVLVLEGRAAVARPVRWVGRFAVDLARHPRPEQAAPVRIAANAVGPGVPRRDLLVSPDHAILLDGVLLQAQSLVNGATIRREPGRRRVTYLHVELERHAILLAEGLPAESFLDTGNRGRFDGEPGVRPLHPDLAAEQSLEVWRARACAPLLLGGPPVAAAHARLKARAKTLGHRLTADPGLRVLADGAEAALVAFSPNHWSARLPAGTRGVRLLTRSFVPTELDPAAVDRRRLGLAVTALALAGRALPASAYGAGWHAAEADWRWTDGDARLRLRPLRRAATLELRAAPAGAGYWQERAATSAVVA